MAVVFMLCLCGNAFALEWGTKELENEKLAIAFANQVSKGGYKIVSTEELKGWIDKKEPMLIVDTMPFEDSYKKNHIPGAVQMEFPLEEMKEMDAGAREKFEKLLGPDKRPQDRILLRLHQVRSQPQCRHVGRKAWLYQCLSPTGRNQGMA